MHYDTNNNRNIKNRLDGNLVNYDYQSVFKIKIRQINKFL